MSSDIKPKNGRDPDPRKEMPAQDAGWTPDQLQSLAEEAASAFPPPRQGTELVLLDVDPRRAHAYWNIDLEDFRQAQAEGAGLPLVLRINEVGGEAPSPSFDMEVQGLQGNWFVNFWREGGCYEGEIGLRRANGELIRFARSEAVRLPGGGAAVTAPAAPPAARETVSDLPDLASDAEPMGLPVVADAPPPPEPARVAEPPSTMPAVAPAAAFAANGEPPTRAVEAQPEAPRPVLERLPSVPAPEQPVGPWPDTSEVTARLPPDSAEVAAWYEKTAAADSAITAAHEQAVRDLGPKPAAESPGPAKRGDSEAPSSHVLPLDSYVTCSSLESGRRQVAIEVNVELHIHGRARPGMEVTLYGQKIPLRPDGTFSVRRPLPHGAVVLPLLATDPETPPPR